MPYTSPADVRGVLTRDPAQQAGTAASMADDELVAAIDAASREVDAKLAVRYTVPFPGGAVPPLVEDLTRDIAAYLADLVYRQGKDYESDRDPVWLRNQRAQELLKALSNGNADLESPTGPDPSAGMVGVQPFRGSMFGLESFDLGVESGRVRTRRL